jgi:hypothetical protein
MLNKKEGHMVDTSDIEQEDAEEVFLRHEETFGETYDNWRAINYFGGEVMDRLLRKALEEEIALTNEKLHQIDENYSVEGPGPEFTL